MSINEQNIRARSMDRLETIEETLDFADVDYKVRREYIVEIEGEDERAVEPVVLLNEGTMAHRACEELAAEHPTELTAEAVASRLDENQYSVSASLGDLYRDGLLTREEVPSLRGTPYSYQLKDEYVEEFTPATEESDEGLGELFG